MRFLCLNLLIVFSINLYGQDEGAKNLTVDQCLQLAASHKEAGDLKEATRYLNTAAIMVWEEKEYTKAIDYFNQSIELNKQLNNNSGIAKLHSNLGMIHADMKQYDKSFEYFQKSLDYRLQHGEKSEIISTRINLSVVLNNLKKHSEAAHSLEAALSLATEMNDAAQMKSCYGMLAETYEKVGNQERTLHYFNLYRTFHEMIQRNSESEVKKEAEVIKLQALQAELEKKEKEIALLNTKRELELTGEELKKLDKDVRGLLDSKTKQELAMDILEGELELKQLRIADAESKSKTQRIWTSVAVIGFIGAILFGVFLYRNYRFKKGVNILLSERNSEIKKLNESLEDQVTKRTLELQKTLTHLKKRNQDLDQFSHIISHNLRGPVARIMGLGNVLNKKDTSDPINFEVFERLLEAIQNLDGVVKDLSVILEVRDNTSMVLEPVDLANTFTKTYALLQTEIEKHHVKLKTSFATVPTIQFVKPYLESIFYNLLSNSIKYRSPNRGLLVEIESFKRNSQVGLVVKDNGIGISSEDLDKIFLPYKRLGIDGEGKGLGLYMVKTQVETLGGTVEVVSEKDKYCTFTILFSETIH